MTRTVSAATPRSSSGVPRGAAGARLAALVALALAACSTKGSSSPIANLAEPTAVAVFRGVTSAHGADPKAAYPYYPHLAVANAQSDDLSIVDAVTDVVLPAPVPLHGLVYPFPFRPALLAAADLGDRKPDLLVAVSGGDSVVKVMRTWEVDGAVYAETDLGATIVALLALPPDPGAPGTARIVAALAGEQIAVVDFVRTASGGGMAINFAGPPETSAPLGFQAVDLAVIPGDRTRVWAATPDTIPLGGVQGVAGVDVTGTPFLATALDALAPTRFVAAARLAEAVDPTALGTAAFDGQPTVDRVYAVLDERGCGFYAPIACGLVALDPAAAGAALLPDPTPAPWQAPHLAPIRLGYALGVATSGPPAFPPDAADPDYAVTWLRIVASATTRATTAAAAAASNDGALTFVDLARWEIPSLVSVHQYVAAAASPVTPSPPDQWLVLLSPDGVTTVGHADPAALVTCIGVTAGYTPTDQWTAAREGVLPWLASRRAEAGYDGTQPWLAMQVSGAGTFSEVVRLFDPVLGVHVEDTVVFDAGSVGTCDAFEATITALLPPDAARYPGGAVQLAHRDTSDPANPEWNRCLDLITGPLGGLRATVRASGYVLVRGAGPLAVHVGRPAIGARFDVHWQDEAPLAAACLLPPARPWPPSASDAAACATDPVLDPSGCRARCEDLVRARLARRVSYLSEAPALVGGHAIAFTLALETAAAPPRDLRLVMSTTEGRLPFRVAPPSASLVGNGPVIAWDRSPYNALAGIRFFSPYTSGVVLDATPTISGGNVNSVR